MSRLNNEWNVFGRSARAPAGASSDPSDRSEYLLRSPSAISVVIPVPAARLKQRQVVEAIAFIINHYVAADPLWRREPLKHLLAPGNPASVWANVVERDTIKLRGKKADRIGSPRRRETHSCSLSGSTRSLNMARRSALTMYGNLRGLGVASEFRTPSMSRKITFIPHERS